MDVNTARKEQEALNAMGDSDILSEQDLAGIFGKHPESMTRAIGRGEHAVGRVPKPCEAAQALAVGERVSQQKPKLLLTRFEAAQALGICERTLDTYTKDGTIPFLRIGSRVLYSVQALEEWISKQSKESA